MKEQAFQYVQNDIRKNAWFDLWLYNLFNTKHGKYTTKKPKNIGQPPHILDSSLVDISRTEIEKWMKSKGYFHAKVKSATKVQNQKASITFNIDSAERFRFGKMSYSIPDKGVKDLFEGNINGLTTLRTGNFYDEDSLTHYRDEIELLLKHNGYFEFEKPYIRMLVDTTLKPLQADLKVYVDNPPGEDHHKVFTINNTTLKIRKNDASMDGVPDSVVINSRYHFFDYSHHFRARPIRRFLFLKKDEIYDSGKTKLTYDRLYALNTFRSVKIDFKKVPDSTSRLNVHYDITPSKRMNNRIEGEYQFNSGRTGFKIANTYANKNIFGGSELLELSVRYNMLFDETISGSLFDRVLSRDFNLGASVSIPHLIPFKFPRLSKNGVPYTIFASNFQVFRQKKLFSNQVFSNSIAYKWSETSLKQHLLTPIAVDYRIGKFDDAFKTELINKGSTLFVLTNNRTFINFNSQYSYIVNAPKLRQLSNFVYFGGQLNLAGNMASLISKLTNAPKTDDGRGTIFNLPFEQYVKAESDFRWYRHLGGDRQFVARLNGGIGIPYGNTKQLAFEKTFMAGGPSGIRAWERGLLGPGNYTRSDLVSDTEANTEVLRRNLRYLDQTGEIKLEANLEYRFLLISRVLGGKLKGAAFTDLGNVWRLHPDTSNPNGEIRLNKLFKQMAIGTGFGIRYDLNFFIIRLDMGIKIKDPQFGDGDQWVIKHLFNRKEFKSNYYEKYKPDTYQFTQFHIGIGMPF